MYSKIGAPTSCDILRMKLIDTYIIFWMCTPHMRSQPIPPCALALTLLIPKHLVVAQKYNDPIVEHKWTSNWKSTSKCIQKWELQQAVTSSV